MMAQAEDFISILRFVCILNLPLLSPPFFSRSLTSSPGSCVSKHSTAKIKNPENLEENLGALEITLMPEGNKEIRRASEAAEVFG